MEDKRLKIFKRIAGVILSLAMAMSLVATIGVVTVKAADDFQIDAAGTLTKYQGEGGAVTIPNTVKMIGEKAFVGNSSITSIKMGDKVTTIKAYAFDGCTNLKTVKLSKNITKIEDGAFYGCSSLNKISLPNKLETIGNSIFCNCTSLNGIYIPASVKDIGAHAFGFSMLGGYTQTANFTIMGDGLAKAYAQKYDFPYTSTSDLKVKPISIKKTSKTTAKLTWVENDKVDKFQIQYSTSAKFSSKKTVNVPNGNVTSKVISGLKKGQTYYVRMRSVTTVAGTTYNSAWSKSKKVVML